MSDATTLADLAEALLTAVEAGFEDAGVGLPERRFVADGVVVHDCEQVAVALDRLYTTVPRAEDPTQMAGALPVLWFATFVIHVVRCVPTPSGSPAGMPSATAITDMGRSIHTDLWLASRSVRTEWAASRLGGACSALQLEEGRPIAHSGGHGGSTTRVTLQVQG